MPHPNKQNKAWQFSIREFLLVVVAVGSLLTLYANQRNFEPTAFSQSFDPILLVEHAMKQLGVSAAQEGAGGGESSGSKRVSMSYRSSYQKIPGTTQPIVLEEVHKIVEKQIVDSGCEILGTGLTGKLDDDSLTEFKIEYKNRKAFGQIRVRTTIGERGDWQFWIDIFEY